MVGKQKTVHAIFKKLPKGVRHSTYPLSPAPSQTKKCQQGNQRAHTQLVLRPRAQATRAKEGGEEGGFPQRKAAAAAPRLAPTAASNSGQLQTRVMKQQPPPIHTPAAQGAPVLTQGEQPADPHKTTHTPLRSTSPAHKKRWQHSVWPRTCVLGGGGVSGFT